MKPRTMRDSFLKELYIQMQQNKKIFFITADFGAPMLDKMRQDFKERIINVGIAEQNAINISVGLALEGYIVYIYAIAPFITMRCFEQIRINCAALHTLRKMNLNIIGVGGGVSYAMSGPTHHCLEDLCLMKMLPNFEVFSPSDSALAESYVERSINHTQPKYIRLDAQPLMDIANENSFDFSDGFRILQNKTEAKTVVISTGFMTQKLQNIISNYNVLWIDLFLLNSYHREKLTKTLHNIKKIITLEEGFSNSGGLDSEISFYYKDKEMFHLGFPRKYTFDIGDREFIHSLNNLGIVDIKAILEQEQI